MEEEIKIVLEDDDTDLTAKMDNDFLKGNPGEGVPVGGIVGQVLSKKTDADYDTEWVDVPGLTGEYVEKKIGNSNDIKFEDGQTFQEKYVSGELKGEQGIQGPQGIQGIQGEQGPVGLTGPQGLQGPTGTWDITTQYQVLNTIDKTVLGAINELNILVAGVETLLSEV